MGSEGHIILGFDNNLLTNSGDNSPDLWVFEVGSSIEASQIDLKPSDQNTINILVNAGIQDNDSDGYFEFGIISGATSSLDIDAYVIGYSFSELRFNAVKITNSTNMECGPGTAPGADIDAVCALSSLPIATDCAGTENGTAQIDECGECLEPNDPNFNLSCIDCAGIINGTAEIDDCGECLELNDPNFNACFDCKDIPNGTAQIDECGECLEPNDPNFNLSCLDCAGILNGTSQMNRCGECLDINNSNFSQLCILIPNAFSPNNDGVNDDFRIFAKNGLNPTIKLYQIHNRWGELVYEANNFMVDSDIYWWDGKFKGKKPGIGVYVYYFIVLFENGEQKEFEGSITLIR